MIGDAEREIIALAGSSVALRTLNPDAFASERRKQQTTSTSQVYRLSGVSGGIRISSISRSAFLAQRMRPLAAADYRQIGGNTKGTEPQPCRDGFDLDWQHRATLVAHAYTVKPLAPIQKLNRRFCWRRPHTSSARTTPEIFPLQSTDGRTRV